MNAALAVAAIYLLPSLLIVGWFAADYWLDRRMPTEGADGEWLAELGDDNLWDDYYGSSDTPTYWRAVAAHERGRSDRGAATLSPVVAAAIILALFVAVLHVGVGLGEALVRVGLG